MPKEKSYNPVQSERKAQKQKEINKNKKQLQSQRNEKLSQRNPLRLQRQIDELKELEGSGALRPKDKETLTQLERDLKGVSRAREALGIKDEPRPERREERRDGDGRTDVRAEQRERRQLLGKRRRDEQQAEDGGSDTDPEVRSIPMPRDTPPPFPRPEYKDPQVGADGQRMPHALPSKPVPSAPAARTVYSSAPQLRDLKKEAVRFMPSVVAQQKNRMKGQGRLLEPEEYEKLEKQGYTAAQKAADEAGLEARFEQVSSEVRAEGKNTDELDEEARRFEEEINQIYPSQAESMGRGRGVMMEEVEDEGT